MLTWMAQRVKNVLYRCRFTFAKKKLSNIKVKTIEETIDNIVNNNTSISRFGDGELMWIFGENNDSFEKNSDQISKNLSKVLQQQIPNHLIGLPDAFRQQKNFTRKSKRIWKTILSKYTWKIIPLLDSNRQYYNANISRMYIDYKDKKRSGMLFKQLKRIWEKRDLLIVEGSMSRLGIGNDLFSNASSINRILCPTKNAYENYSEILTCLLKYLKAKPDTLTLLALGPTATILAADVAKNGFQAIDIGHVDIEYEWYIMGAIQKKAIPGKYVNEVPEGRKFSISNDDAYKKQIICKIGI